MIVGQAQVERGARARPAWSAFPDAQRALGDKRVLLIGDDVESSGRAFISLTHAGAQVRLVRRTVQVPEFLEQTPTLIIVDVDRVQGRAADLARNFRAAAATARAVLVGLTPPAFRGHRRPLLAAGYDELVAKPVNARSFAQELVGAVGRLRGP